MKKLEEYVRSIPDFPEPGIIFRDITTILQDADGLQLAIDRIQKSLEGVDYDIVVGPESRGFIFGVPVAYAMHKGFVPIRKKGKLPCKTVSVSYDLEYGSAVLEMHEDAIKPGQKVVIVDDLIATGGTTEAIVADTDRGGVKVLDNISFILGREDKVAFVGPNEQAKTVLFKILSGEMEPDEGSYKWGLTTSQAYFPKDNSKEFDNDDTIVDWLTQYSPVKDVTYVRGFLGRMLFAGEDGVKKVRVLSGGEKVRCMLSKMMISGSNVLILDEPTDHLDMESITALNNGMIKFPGVLLFSSRDHQIVETTANRIMEIVNGKLIDKITTYDEYLANDEMARKRQVFTVTDSEEEDD